MSQYHTDPPEPYKSWQHMRDRCLNPRNKDYAHYGGRGITICSEWDSYARFLEDMGPKPSGMTLDRAGVLAVWRRGLKILDGGKR